MVFYIDKSIKYELSVREMTENEIFFFSSIADAYRHGYCYLCGNIDSLDYLSEHLGKPFNNIYNLVKNRYAENGEITRIVSKVCILTFQKELSLNMLPEFLQDENKSIFIPIQFAIEQDIKLAQPCCLLAENLNDCEFYEIIAKYYCYKNAIEKFNVKFHYENGGGNTTCDILDKVVKGDRFLTLCIVDSDRSYGSSKEYPGKQRNGGTLNRVYNVSKTLSELSLPPYEIYPLHVHEVENLIPFEVLQSIMQNQLPAMELGLNFLEKLQKIDNGEPVLYYDFKKGFPYIKEKPKQAYWRYILSQLKEDDLTMPPKTKNDIQDNQVVIFPSLSDNDLLERAIKNLKEREKIQQLHIDDYLLHYWDEIGKLVLTWGCANLPIST